MEVLRWKCSLRLVNKYLGEERARDWNRWRPWCPALIHHQGPQKECQSFLSDAHTTTTTLTNVNCRRGSRNTLGRKALINVFPISEACRPQFMWCVNVNTTSRTAFDLSLLEPPFSIGSQIIVQQFVSLLNANLCTKSFRKYSWWNRKCFYTALFAYSGYSQLVCRV